MPIYSVEGKLGTGKTKFAVFMAQQALIEGRRVVSNVDLNLEFLVPSHSRHYVRLPDKPKSFDLEAAGHGNPDSYDEDMNGVMILDELGTWLNSRSYQDKDRAPLLDWLIHARKYGWDVFLIVQDASMIDKQVRDALIEYQCKCFRGDKIRIPVIGGFLSSIKKSWGYFPKFHMVVARVGSGAQSVIAERWFYRGSDLHAAYDTRQVFSSSYPHGSHSVYRQAVKRKPSFFSRIFSGLFRSSSPRPVSMYWSRPRAAFGRPSPSASSSPSSSPSASVSPLIDAVSDFIPF